MSKLFKNCYFISYALSAQNAASLRKRQEKGKWFNFYISLLATELLGTPSSRQLYAVKLEENHLEPLFALMTKCMRSFETPPFSKNDRKLKFWYWRNGICHLSTFSTLVPCLKLMFWGVLWQGSLFIIHYFNFFVCLWLQTLNICSA